jgi:spermidine/putrescine transport system substrate-binding protein
VLDQHHLSKAKARQPAIGSDLESPAVTNPLVPRRTFLRGIGGAVLVGGVGPGLLAACGDDEDDGAGTRDIGGDLRMLNWGGYEDKAVTASFRNKHGVTVKSSPIANNDEIFTKLRAGALGSIDLASPNIAFVEALASADLVTEIDFSRIPNARNFMPHIKERIEDTKVDGKSYAVPFLWGDGPMLYNAKFIKTPPQSWLDVQKPEYKNKVAMTDDGQANIITWAPVLGYDDPTRLTQEELDRVIDFLVELKRTQVRTFGGTWNDVADQMAAGDIWLVGSGGWEIVQAFAAEKGGRVEWTYPREGAMTWTDAWVIPKDAPNEATAYAWINAVLAPEAQAEFATKLVSATVSSKAVSLLDEKDRALYPYDDPQQLAELEPSLLPPSDPPEGITTYNDWTKAWAKVQAA